MGSPVPPPLGGDAGQVLTKFSDDERRRGLELRRGWNVCIDVSIGATTSLQDGDYLRWSTVRGLWINQPRAMLNVVREPHGTRWRGDEGTFMVLDQRRDQRPR